MVQAHVMGEIRKAQLKHQILRQLWVEDFPDPGWLRDLGSKPVRDLPAAKANCRNNGDVGPGGDKHSLKPRKGNDCNNTTSDDCVTTETPWPLRL